MCLRICVLSGVLVLCFLLPPPPVGADCTCSPAGGSVLQGMEFVAKSCPEEGDDDDTERLYVSQWILCSGGNLVRNSMFPSSEGMQTVNEIVSTANSYNNTKILRNESGTHIIAVHRYYQGTVAGVSPAVGVTTHENLNEYCTHDGDLADSDSDGFPYCLDCDDLDPELNLVCESCQQEYQEKIAECKGEELILFFDYVSCTGHCRNVNNGPPMCLL